MDDLFNALTLHDVHGDLLRNIKSIRRSQELFDDLSDDPTDWELAKQAELHAKLPLYTDRPIIRRPFERARYINAVRFPFQNWAQSRFSDGTFGVWYGADKLETTVYETVYHWHRFLRAADLHEHDKTVIGERRVYKVRCDATLLDFRSKAVAFPALVDPCDYTYTRDVGRRIHREGHPGLVSGSARCNGAVFAVFREQVLTRPRNYCDLTYILKPKDPEVRVERRVGRKWISVPVDAQGQSRPI